MGMVLVKSPFNLIHPYVTKANAYKGQLHCHSTESDGDLSPSDAVTAYKNAGYDFVCLSDHEKKTTDPAVGGILFIPATEETATGMHILNVGAARVIGGSVPQTIIDAIVSDGAFCVINHPLYPSTLLTAEDINALSSWHAVDLYNYTVTPNSNAETIIDGLLALNRNVYGIGVDDCHLYATKFNKAWVHVFADELTQAAIIASLKAGNCYPSTGPTITVAVAGRTITVTTPDAATITWIKAGSVVQTNSAATQSSYRVTSAGFVRAKVVRDSDGGMAWTQPFSALAS